MSVVTDKRFGWRRNVHGENRVVANWLAHGYPRELMAPQLWEHRDGLQAFLTREWAGGRPTDPLRWHISVQGPGRVPTWSEMTNAAHGIRPGVYFVMAVPPRELWMNVHEHVLHLWETEDAPLIQEWRVNATGQAPT